MKQLVHQHYSEFDTTRKALEAQKADEDEMRALEALEKKLAISKKGGGK